MKEPKYCIYPNCGIRIRTGRLYCFEHRNTRPIRYTTQEIPSLGKIFIVGIVIVFLIILAIASMSHNSSPAPVRVSNNPVLNQTAIKDLTEQCKTMCEKFAPLRGPLLSYGCDGDYEFAICEFRAGDGQSYTQSFHLG